MPSPAVLDTLNHPRANAESFAYLLGTKGLVGSKHLLDFNDLVNVELSAFGEVFACFRSGDICVGFAGNNISNRPKTDPKGFGDLPMPHAAGGHFKNLRDLRIAKQSGRRGRAFIDAVQSVVVGVLDVLCVRNPLKVLQAVIGLDSIDVVCRFLPDRRRPHKGVENHPMYNDVCLLDPRSNWCVGQVAASVLLQLQNAVSIASWASRQAFDPAQVAHSVKAFPPWNITPDLAHGRPISLRVHHILPSTLGV